MTGAAVGLLFAVGLLVTVRGWAATRPDPPLIRALRMAPAFALPERPVPRLLEAVRPALGAVARIAGGRAAVRRRLQLLGEPTSVESYLFSQLLGAGAFACAALLLVVLLGDPTRAGPTFAVVGLAAVGGLLFGDYRLGRRVRSRRALIAEQFPVAAQLLALLVAAGVPPADAVERVGRAVGGPLGELLREAAAGSGAGKGFAAAMRDLAAATDLASIDRFVFGLLSAIERGSPLAEILRAQALEAADEQHRQLMISAGKRDIAMLVPVVFAVLPTVVMVSLLPGAAQLGLVGG